MTKWMLLAFVLFYGCNGGSPVSAPAAPAPPLDPDPVTVPAPWALAPSAAGAVEINGLVTCNYAQGALSGCALNSGASLDDFANSVLWGVGLTEER